MPDYKKMYTTLFNASTDAITVLQKAQQDAESLYIEANDTPIELLQRGDEPKDDE